MKTITVEIIDPIGIHARPASVLVNVSSKFKSNVSFKSNDKIANAKSIINLMALGAKQGSKVEIIVEGDDEAEAIEQIKETMKKEKLID